MFMLNMIVICCDGAEHLFTVQGFSSEKVLDTLQDIRCLRVWLLKVYLHVVTA